MAAPPTEPPTMAPSGLDPSWLCWAGDSVGDDPAPAGVDAPVFAELVGDVCEDVESELVVDRFEVVLNWGISSDLA